MASAMRRYESPLVRLSAMKLSTGSPRAMSAESLREERWATPGTVGDHSVPSQARSDCRRVEFCVLLAKWARRVHARTMTITAAEHEVDLAVSRVVKMLLAYRGETQAALAQATGLGRKTVIRRMSGERGWSAAELATLSKHFEVPVSVFYDGPDALLRTGIQTVTHQYESPTKQGGTTVSSLKSSTPRGPRSSAVRPCGGAVKAA